MEKLTPKQDEVVRLMAKGLTNGKIAEHMGITLAGAKWHVGEVMSKYGVTSREAAVRAWKQERSIGARLGRMASALPLPALLGGSAAAGIAAVAVVVAVAVHNSGDLATGKDAPAHEELTGDAVHDRGIVHYPEHFANSVTRQVTYAEWSASETTRELPPELTEYWVERGAGGAVDVVYMGAFDRDGNVAWASRTDEDDHVTFRPNRDAEARCAAQSQRFPDAEYSGSMMGGPPPSQVGLPAFRDTRAGPGVNLEPAEETLIPARMPDSPRLHDEARERFATDFSAVETWTVEVDAFSMTVSFEEGGMEAGRRLNNETAVPGFHMVTEVFDLDVGIELRKQVIPWEEWCPD